MARSDRERRLEALRAKVASPGKEVVTDADRRDPDFDGRCSVPGRFLRGVLQAERAAARLACEVHDKRAKDIRGWLRDGFKIIEEPYNPNDPYIAPPYDVKTPPWREDVDAANVEFLENLRIGMGRVKARLYYWGVANWLGRRSFRADRGPLARKLKRERKRRKGRTTN